MIGLETVGVIVMLVGFVLVFLTVLLSSRSRGREGEEQHREVKGGGVIMIGPIPIIFGSDARWTSVAIILAIVLVVVSFIFMQYAVHLR